MSAKRKVFIAAAVVLAYMLFFIAVLASHGWDPGDFILEKRPEVPLEQGWDIGYDAQWYYQIAADPLGAAGGLDLPAFRYQRIVFPILIYLVSLGQVAWMPWAMLVINLAAAFLATYLLADLLSRKYVSPWFALAFCGSFGYMLAMRLDLLEPLTIALALAGWKIYFEKKPDLGIILFALAGLTKEIGLVFPLSIIAWLLCERRWREAAWLALGSLLPYFTWRAYLQGVLGNPAKAIAQSRLSWPPFTGFEELGNSTSMLFVGLWVMLPGILCVLFILWQLRKGIAVLRQPQAYLVLAQFAMIAVLPRPTWLDPLAVLRTGLGLLAALILYLGASYPRALPYLAALYIPSCLLAFLVPGFI